MTLNSVDFLSFFLSFFSFLSANEMALEPFASEGDECC